MAFQRFVSLHGASYLCYLIAELNTFLEKLDNRYEAKIKKQGMLMARKTRSVGSPSSSVTPLDTASWTIDNDWEKSELHLYNKSSMCYFSCYLFMQMGTHIESSWNILILNIFLSHLTYTHT